MARQSPRLLIAVLVLILSPALDAAQRTFVSAGLGSDANNCSRLSPCRNFAAAVTQTDPGGEVVVLDSGGYGPVTLTQAVALISPEGVYAGITAFSGDGVTIDAGSSDRVILRGLSINGLGGGNGITLLTGKELGIYGVAVTNFSYAGIELGEGGSHTAIRDSVITGPSAPAISDGIVIGGSIVNPAYVMIENTLINRAYHCVFSLDNARVTVTNSVATGCLGAGYRVNGTGSQITIEHSAAVNGNVGIMVGCTTGIARISNSTFVNNTTGVVKCAGTLYSRGNNTIHGNTTDIAVGTTLTTLNGQ